MKLLPPIIRFYLLTVLPPAALAATAAFILPGHWGPFCAMLSLWLLSAIAILLGFYVAPPSLLVAGENIGRQLQHFNIIPDRVFLAGGFVFFAIASAVLSGTMFHHLPQWVEGISHYIDAKSLALGQFSFFLHPLPEFFSIGSEGISPSPLHIFLLAIGHLAHVPWVVNPLLGASCVIAVYALGRELYSPATARLAALLTCLCPLMLSLSAGFTSHAAVLLFITLSLLFFIRMLRTATTRNACLAAASFGGLLFTQPYAAFALILPCALFALYLARSYWHTYRKPFCLLFSAFLLLAFIHFLWTLYRLPPPGIYPYGVSILSTFTALNDRLFEWPLPSLFLALALLICGIFIFADWIVLGAIVSLLIAPLLWGNADLHYNTLLLWVLLTAEAIIRLPRLLVQRFKCRISAASTYGICACLLLLLYPLSPHVVTHYKAYADKSTKQVSYYQNIVQGIRVPALVFIPGGNYSSVAFTLPPTENSEVIFARDLQAKNMNLLEYYPCRFAYIVKNASEMSQIQAPKTPCKS